MNSAEKVTADIAVWKAQGIEKADLMARIGEEEIGWPYAWGATGQLCTVANRKAKINSSKIGQGDKELIRKHCQILNGSKSVCTGCKYFPDDQRTKLFDCIGFVNQLLNWAEIDHYGAGCTTMWNRNSNWSQKGKLAEMPDTPCLVFRQKPGSETTMEHIGFYYNGVVYHCSVEVKKQKLGDYKWTHYAIPKGMGGVVPPEPTPPEPTPVPPYDKRPTLRKGSRGEYVKLAQTELINAGYSCGKQGADGIFGKNTEAAVINFQKLHKDYDGKALVADGIIGKRTWWALDQAQPKEKG